MKNLLSLAKRLFRQAEPPAQPAVMIDPKAGQICKFVQKNTMVHLPGDGGRRVRGAIQSAEADISFSLSPFVD